MPHGSRAAILFVAAGLSAVAASIPAQGQTGDVVGRPGGIARPDIALRPRFPDSRRDLPPSPSPWSKAPAPGAGSSPGVVTQKRAMDLLAAAGFTRINVPEPSSDGSWTAYATDKQGVRVRATVRPQGDISSRK
jgi:hypothetical protein